MWIRAKEIYEIDNALKDRKFHVAGRLLDSLARNGEFRPEREALCPSCGKPLVQKAAPYLELVLSVCPEGHGAWMANQTRLELHRMVIEQLQLAAKRKNLLRLAAGFTVIIAGSSLLVNSPGPVNRYFQEKRVEAEHRRIGTHYWPLRGEIASHSLPLTPRGIEDPEEVLYLRQLTDILTVAVSHRMNMESVLKTKRSAEEYRRIYTNFAAGQNEVEAVLGAVSVPGNLKPVNDKIREALFHQTHFYGAFVERKISRSATAMEDMLRHPAHRRAQDLLNEAWIQIRRTYPEMDLPSQIALQRRILPSERTAAQ